MRIQKPFTPTTSIAPIQIFTDVPVVPGASDAMASDPESSDTAATEPSSAVSSAGLVAAVTTPKPVAANGASNK